MMRLPFIGIKDLINELSPIMTRLPFIGVTNFSNELPSIMTRLPFIGETYFHQRTTFHNDKATIHWDNKFSSTNYLT